MAVLLFAGCMSTQYGVDRETWDGMSEEQRNVTIAAYHERKQLEAERRLIEEKRRLIEAEAAQGRVSELIDDAIANAPRIEVSVWAGFLRNEDQVVGIDRTVLVLRYGQGAELEVKGDHGQHSTVVVAYRRGCFIFGEGDGTIEIPYEDDWHTKQLYLERIPQEAKYSGTVHLGIRALGTEEENGEDSLLRLVVEELLD